MDAAVGGLLLPEGIEDAKEGKHDPPDRPFLVKLGDDLLGTDDGSSGREDAYARGHEIGREVKDSR